MINSSTREIVARIIDPKAFSHLYRGNRDEAKWLANKKRAIEAAIKKADAVLAVIAQPGGGELDFVQADYERAARFAREWLSAPYDPLQHPEWLNIARAFLRLRRDSLESSTPVGGEVVELLRALTPRCTFGITNYNGSGQPCPGDVSPESLCCRARKALAALSPDPTEGGTDE